MKGRCVEGYRNLPTEADYAREEARYYASRPEPEKLEKGLTLEERVVILEGQVSFLAGFIDDMLSIGWHRNSDLKTLRDIYKYGKE